MDGLGQSAAQGNIQGNEDGFKGFKIGEDALLRFLNADHMNLFKTATLYLKFVKMHDRFANSVNRNPKWKQMPACQWFGMISDWF